MAPITNSRHLFSEIPKDLPEPGKTTVYDTSQTIDLDAVPLDGGFLVKVLVLSLDPFMRAKMRDPSIKAYAPPFIIGDPLNNYGIGVVLRSETASFKPGDHIYGFLPFQEYFVRKSDQGLRIIKNEEGLSWSSYLGIAGMPGQTAFFGWKEYSHPKDGDTVFVTTGAGPVGSMVAQLAKLDGLKVIACAGSDDKVNLMKEIGVDVAFNYKTTSTSEVLQKEGPIDIYWDNVGGEILDIALANAASGARFIECGMISHYRAQPLPFRNLFNIVARQIKMNGFIVTSLAPKYSDEFYATVPKMLQSGALKQKEEITHGLDKVGETFAALLKGENTAKIVVHVADE